MASPRDEALYWEGQVDDLRRSGLKTVRDAAAKWQGFIAAFLGIFGSAAFIKGPSTFKDLGVGHDTAGQFLALVLAAVMFAFVALYCTARATTDVPKVRYWSGRDLQRWTQREAVASIRWLQAGRVFTLLAAVIVVGGSTLVVATALGKPSSPVNALVKRADGAVLCGAIDRPSALRLTVQSRTYDLTASDTITFVDRCPSP